ncbi:sensor histidine kinase [Paenibacillus sp. N1-5-1-14]|nr:sensor histidine kinase [Paenibacillus radicibacter]
MLSYCLMMIIPLLLVGSFASSTFVNSVQEHTRTNIQATLTQVKDNMVYKIDDAKRVTDILYQDTAVFQHLKHYEEGWTSYEATTKYLIPRFQQMVESMNEASYLSIYLHNDTLPEIYYTHENASPLASNGQMFDMYHMKRIVNKSWYRDFPEEKYGATMQWKQVEDDGKYGQISLLRRIVDTSDFFQMRELGFVRITLSMDYLFKSVDHRKFGEKSAIFIVDEEDRIVYLSGDRTRRIGDKWTNSDDDKNQLTIQESIPSVKWKLITLVSTEIMEQELNKVRELTFLICLICLIAFFFIGMSFTQYFSKRVRKIVAVLNAFREGDFHKRMRYKGNDEFAQITSALNDMGHNTEELIRVVYLTDIQKKEAELEALQAQINPHFLYNTLSSISQLSKFGEAEKLQRMVKDLATFYRLTLNEGRLIIPIAKELEQVQAYLNIKKTKHGDRMEVLIDVKPDVYQFDTVKLILQPFIENILEHAWFGDHIHIRIAGELDNGVIEFRIIDNGVGIHPDLIQQILHPEHHVHVGYGIRNVDQRIKLHAGKDYGVSIYSKLGMGTTVVIRIPARRM